MQVQAAPVRVLAVAGAGTRAGAAGRSEPGGGGKAGNGGAPAGGGDGDLVSRDHVLERTNYK